MPVQYSFVTHWQTQAPLAEVWTLITESEHWPEWWDGVLSVVEIVPGDDNGIGSIRRYTLRSPTYYKLTFDLLLTERIDHQLLSGKASGELEGIGEWHFLEDEGTTYIECHWDVHTNIAWMNAFAFILRPIFKLNHKIVMKQGARSLARKLGKSVAVID